MNEVSSTANRLPWQLVLGLGVVFFAVCYWLLPYALVEYAASSRLPIVRAALEAIAVRRGHWFQFVAVAGGLLCAYYTIRNYLGARAHSRDGEKQASLVARILARWID